MYKFVLACLALVFAMTGAAKAQIQGFEITVSGIAGVNTSGFRRGSLIRVAQPGPAGPHISATFQLGQDADVTIAGNNLYVDGQKWDDNGAGLCPPHGPCNKHLPGGPHVYTIDADDTAVTVHAR